MRYLALIVALLALAVGWSFFWWRGAETFRVGAEEWLAARQQAGGIAEVDGLAVEGYPFRLVLVVTAPRLGEPGAWRWQAARLDLILQPWDWHHVIAEIRGAQSLTIGPRVLTSEAESTQLSLKLDTDNRFGTAVLVTRRGRLALDGQSYLVDRLQLAARALPTADRPDGYDLAASVDGLTLPPTLDGPLGRLVTTAEMIGTTSFKFADQPLRQAVETWKAGGGTIELSRAQLTWGPVSLNGDATVTLDKDNRLEGAGAFATRGLDRLVDAVAQTGQLGSDPGLVRAAVGIFAATGAKLPVSAQGGRLFVGPMAVARLEPLF